MPSIGRLLRYPRLVVVSGYVAVVLGSLVLGMRVSTADPAPLDLLSLIVTVAVGVGILHHAYTREWERR
jgi:hypothetical protein